MKKTISLVLVSTVFGVLVSAAPARAKGRDVAMIVSGSISVGLVAALIYKVFSEGDAPKPKQEPSPPPPQQETLPPATPTAGDPFRDWKKELAINLIPPAAVEAGHE